MKKIFIAVLAVAALASCATDEIVSTPKGAAIGFDEAFVNNSTRANDLNKDNLANFGVYGFVEANGTQGQIFTNQEVKKEGGAFTYSPTQYWIAAAQYYFTAIAPYQSGEGATWTYATTDAQNGTITFHNDTAVANQDLLFAYKKPATTPTQITTQPDAVAFDFVHTLSRIKFTFKNSFATGSNIDLKVSAVTVTNAHKNGTIAVTDGVLADDWTPSTATFEKVFGNADGTVGAYLAIDEQSSASTEHFYLIPANANATFNVTFTIDLYQAGVKVDTYNRSSTVVIADMTRGSSYDIVAALTPQNVSDDGQLFPIVFTVNSVEEWVNFGEVPAPGYEVPAQGNN